MKRIIQNKYCENEVLGFIQHIQKSQRNKYKIIIGILLILVFSVINAYLFEQYILIFVSISVVSLTIVYILFLIDKLKNIEQSVEYLSLLKPDNIYLSKKYVCGQKNNLSYFLAYLQNKYHCIHFRLNKHLTYSNYFFVHKLTFLINR